MASCKASRRSFKTHYQAVQNAEKDITDHLTAHDQTRYGTHTLAYGSSSSQSKLALPLPPQPLRLYEPVMPANTGSQAAVPPILDNSSGSKKQTQHSATLQDFHSRAPWLLDLLLEHEGNEKADEECPCHQPGARRTTHCFDCTSYQTACSQCFILSHAALPTHWAEVWSFEAGYYVRHDIAALAENISSVYLGHSGKPCPSEGRENLHFIIVDTNGIHSTKLSFCYCAGYPNRPKQLMEARLFPATITQPTTAFTFRVLQQFHIHHLESKESVHDFMGSLRRLTDGAFPQKIPDLSSQFRLVLRIYRWLTAQKRQGQSHGIDALLPHRRPGSLVVYCPACPEIDFNMESGWQTTPSDLRHLNQSQHTTDGNHHANKYIKNTDPDDVSLYEGRAYFPADDVYQHYLKDLSGNQHEKTPCDHLNAINNQDRKKFRNMDITGIVNIQCSHIFIKSSVDLQLGEKFANTDYALSHALRQTNQTSGTLDPTFVEGCDHVFSYDINCGYCQNAVCRFESSSHLQSEAPFLKHVRYLIPLLHVQNHKDNCTYLYSSAYVPNVGHFFGETAEHTWPELNQLGAQTRQMNNGHRQDTIIDHPQ